MNFKLKNIKTKSQILKSILSYNIAKLYSIKKIKNYFSLTLQTSYTKEIKNFSPGQFIQIKPEKYFYPLFMRPFSIYDVEEKIINNKKHLQVTIIFKVVGEATYNLSRLKIGDKIYFIAPLGNGFNLNNIKNAIIVAGGIGFVPLVPLIKKLKEKNNSAKIYFFYGAKNKDEITNLKEIRKYSDKIFIATEDGSLGKKGLITELLKKVSLRGNEVFEAIPNYNGNAMRLHHGVYTEQSECVHNDKKQNYSNNFKIFSCGPKPLLKEIQNIALQKNIPAEISLEEKMICGYGVCLGCVVKNKNNEFIKCCSEGPVFNAKDVKLF